MTTTCTGTQAITANDALAAELAAQGSPLKADNATTIYGRKICGTCEGLVLATKDGSLRKHAVRSNRR